MIKIESYQVFLGFTKDLEKEEKAFRECLNSYNKEIRKGSRMEYYPVTWKDIPSGHGPFPRLQDCINVTLLGESDYSVFVLHESLGSPSGKKDDKTGIQKTGLIEEFELAQSFCGDRDKCMQDVALFFKKVSKKRLNTHDKNLKKVEDFKSKLAGLSPFYHEYKTIDQFKEGLRFCLSKWKEALQPPSITSVKNSLGGKRQNV